MSVERYARSASETLTRTVIHLDEIHALAMDMARPNRRKQRGLSLLVEYYRAPGVAGLSQRGTRVLPGAQSRQEVLWQVQVPQGCYALRSDGPQLPVRSASFGQPLPSPQARKPVIRVHCVGGREYANEDFFYFTSKIGAYICNFCQKLDT